jgi:transposase-like protein
VVLDILVQERRDATAAKRFFKRLLIGLQYSPRVIVTDKLRSYGVAAPSAPPSRASAKPIISTTALRTPIDQHDVESARCSDSDHPNRRSVSSPLTRSSTVVSTRDDTD